MAQRSDPTKNRRSTPTTRKSVTIDLEAEPVNLADGEPAKAPAGETAQTPAAKPADDTKPTAPRVDDKKPEPAKPEPAKPEPAKAAASQSTKAETKPETKPDTKAKSGGMGALGAGIIGGIVTLLGAAGLQWGGVLPSPGQAPPIEQVDLTPVNSQIAQLQSQIETLSTDEGMAAANIPADISTQIAAANDAAAQAQAQAAELATQLQAAQADLTRLSQNIAAGGAGENAGLEAIASRMGALEEQIATATSQLESGSPETQEAVAALSSSSQALTGDIAELRENVTGISQRVETIAGEMSALSVRMDETQELAQAGGQNSQTIATAVAAAGLRSAIDRGGPFMTELEAYSTVAGDSEAIAALREFAGSGVDTVAQLADGFGSVANAIVAAGQGLDENAGIADRLMASARNLVQVRPVGEVEGDSPGAIAARMEARLKAGDLAGALAQWETLPQAAQAVSADFVDRIKARQNADTMISDILNGAMGAARNDASPAQ